MRKLMEKATDWAARLAGAGEAIRELHSANRDLRAAHAAAVKARDHLVSAPPPRDEILAAMQTLVDQQAEAWAKEHGRGLVAHLGPGLELKMDGSLVERRANLPDWLTAGDLRVRALVGPSPSCSRRGSQPTVAAPLAS